MIVYIYIYLSLSPSLSFSKCISRQLLENEKQLKALRDVEKSNARTCGARACSVR